MIRFLKVTLSACLAMLGLVAVAAPAHADGGFGLKIHSSHKGVCLSSPVSVAPAAGQPRDWRVQVTLCQPFRFTREVDVLTHGATYTGSYWDWPQQPALYSYVGRTLAAGRATLNYDRIGNGASTRPLVAAEITMASDAYVLHQLVGLVRSLGYRQVTSISHSYGSGVALAEASTYQDVDGLVLSGYLHRPSNPAVTAGNYPAWQDDMFSDDLDPQYLTSRPGVRGSSFHSPTSDPAVVAFDDAHKDLVALSGLLGFLGARGVPAATNISNLVTVPVLVLNGQQDAIFCYQPATFDCADAVAVTNNEAPYYAHVASFAVVTIADSGHDLTLHPSAATSFQIINDWRRETS